MVEQLLGSVHCFNSLQDGPGDVIIKRLRNHPEILCEDSDYKWYRAFVFLPGIVLWAVIFPVWMIWVYFKMKDKVYRS